MKFRNPYYVSPVEAEAALLAPKIQAWLQGKPAKEFVGLDRLKTVVPETATASREAINHALRTLGVDVDEAGANDA